MISDTGDCATEPLSSVADDRLRLMFTCCHPALATSAQVALTLRLLGGLTVAEIASAFLVEEAAMAKRLTRSKQKIKAARIPYRVPSDPELPDRLRGVLATLFLVFNEGYPPRPRRTHRQRIAVPHPKWAVLRQCTPGVRRSGPTCAPRRSC